VSEPSERGKERPTPYYKAEGLTGFKAATYFRDAILEAYPNHQANAERVVASLEPSLLPIFTAINELEKQILFKDACKAKAGEVVNERIAAIKEQQVRISQSYSVEESR
jgi:hypothetical protein